jgi:hypothetical protein
MAQLLVAAQIVLKWQFMLELLLQVQAPLLYRWLRVQALLVLVELPLLVRLVGLQHAIMGHLRRHSRGLLV